MKKLCAGAELLLNYKGDREMKWLLKKENLFVRIAIGFAAGIAIGFLAPGLSHDAAFIGSLYLNLIKIMVIPVLICAVSSGIINSGDIGSLKRIGAKTVVLYILMFLASFAVSFAVAGIIRPGAGVSFENQPVFEGEAGALSLLDALLDICSGSG